MTKRLIWHIFPSYMAVLLVATTAVVWGAGHAIDRFHLAWTRRELESAVRMAAEQMRGSLEKSLEKTDAAAVDRMCKTLGRVSHYRLTLILPDGTVAGDSERDPATMENHADRPEVRAALQGGMGEEIRYSQTMGRNMLYVAVPVLAGGRAAGVARVSVPLFAVQSALHAMWVKLFLLGLWTVVVAGGASAWVAHRLSRRLRHLRGGAEAFARGRLEHRVDPSGITEFDALGDTMNLMADGLRARMATLARQRDEQSAIFSCMVEGVIAVDEQKRVINLNHAARQIFRLEDVDFTGRNILEVVRNADLLDVVEQTLKLGGPVEKQIYLPDPDRYLQARSTVLAGRHEKELGGAVIVLSDITRMRKLETVRRDFVENVSHELKTPITSIRGFADTLLDGAAANPEDRQRFLEVIARQAERLQSIIEDMLTLSSIEHGAESGEIELRRASVGPLLESVARSCQPAAQEAGLALEVKCGEGLDVEMNQPLLEQAVTNLVDNAIKYAADGKRVEIVGEACGGEVAIRVVDHGPGIPQRHLPRLFERFYRIDKGRSRKIGGTGLGLAIVKRVALAHRGRVEASSELEQGSTFSVYLPRASE